MQCALYSKYYALTEFPVHVHQRIWRKYRAMMQVYFHQLLDAWNKLEPTFRKQAAAATDSKLVGAKNNARAPPPPPARKGKAGLVMKIPAIPHEVMWIREYIHVHIYYR